MRSPPFTCGLPARCPVPALRVRSGSWPEGTAPVGAVVLRAGWHGSARSFGQGRPTSLTVSSEQRTDDARAFPSTVTSAPSDTGPSAHARLHVPCRLGPSCPQTVAPTHGLWSLRCVSPSKHVCGMCAWRRRGTLRLLPTAPSRAHGGPLLPGPPLEAVRREGKGGEQASQVQQVQQVRKTVCSQSPGRREGEMVCCQEDKAEVRTPV